MNESRASSSLMEILQCIHKYKSEMLTCESFIHNSNILFINKHMFSIIVCLFIITIDNNFFSPLSRIQEQAE